MLTFVLLVATIALTGGLSLYGLTYLVGAVRFAFLRFAPRPIAADPQASVSVLVPAHREGPAVIDTVETLLNQTYAGPIHIAILLDDEADSSFPPLREKYALDEQLTADRGNRRVRVHLTGLRPKHAKINRVLPEIHSDYIALLDADHRADAQWLRTSVAVLEESDHVAVQSVRRPLDTRRLFQFWDSAENHIGNEVFNHLAAAWGLNALFTGTTCVFRSAVLRERGLPASITEDTALSYGLLIEGNSLAYNRDAGSYEDVAPDFSTYIARRRRWSNGHNQTFLRYLSAIFTAPLPWRKRLQLVIHGGFFAIPLAIVALANCFGIFFFFQLTDGVRWLAVLLSIVFAALLSGVVSRGAKAALVNTAVAWCWIFPTSRASPCSATESSATRPFFRSSLFPTASISGRWASPSPCLPSSCFSSVRIAWGGPR
ncbi:MAG: glycosyltransferase family 2 protein [Myxococcota bacterium]